MNTSAFFFGQKFMTGEGVELMSIQGFLFFLVASFVRLHFPFYTFHFLLNAFKCTRFIFCIFMFYLFRPRKMTMP